MITEREVLLNPEKGHKKGRNPKGKKEETEGAEEKKLSGWGRGDRKKGWFGCCAPHF